MIFFYKITFLQKLNSFLFLACVLCIVLFEGCQGNKTSDLSSNSDSSKLFQLLSPAQTNINFRNDIEEDESTNLLMYEYTYNGGGVAVGDLNNDGLDDIYFTANEKENKLYLNKGKLKFEDITSAAGVSCTVGWKTGVTMADVNGDGLLDIYVCRSGNLPGGKRKNKLFINKGSAKNGIPKFAEEAHTYGLADSAFSTHASFFDYDRDHDLDLILINHSPRRFENLDDTRINQMMNTPDELTGVKLYRNEKNKFTEVTTLSGLNNTRLSYSLGVSVADVNNDGWPDIYLSNDYLAPDYLYLNNQDGTFTDQKEKMLGHTSQFSMGNDIADINNDELPDILTLDMLPEDNKRQKLLFASDNYELFDLRNRTGLHKQYMRNMLHVNNGDGTFSEVGQLANISNSDWSWAPLFADYDNDGWKDLFCTNGYVHDYTNMDFLKYMGDYLRDNQGNVQQSNLLELVKKMPSSNVTNYIFRNNGGITFKKANLDWGITRPSNSNGAAYTDLDNDGDLDLVINNINESAYIYQNNSNKLSQHNFLKVKLAGEKQNKFGVGTKIIVYAGGLEQAQEQLISRGFQSSVSPVLHFGLGKEKTVDSLQVIWPSGKEQWLRNISTGKAITLHEVNATQPVHSIKEAETSVFTATNAPINYKHQENNVNDFKRQPLMTNSLSYSGPCLVKGDINNDKLEDIFVGGASGYEGKIFLQQKNGQFKPIPQPALVSDYLLEDTDAAFLDSDKDGDLDLYVCSGGYDNFRPGDALLQDRLYLNNGKGVFSKNKDALPPMFTSSSCVRVADVNNDGNADLFISGRVVPGRYPESPRSYILINNGQGHFQDQTKIIAPELMQAGMITDAAWADMNGDKTPDLITAGEWMPLQIWINTQGKLTDKTTDFFNKKEHGWWNRLLITDLNSDGKPDIVAGNMGLNTQCKVSEQEPAELYYKDYDDNGAVDPILCSYIQGKSYPNVSRDELLDQISTMRTRFTDYKSYADAQLKDIFTKEELAGAKVLRANNLQTKCYISTPTTKYKEGELPLQMQYAPIHALETLDYNNDGKKDLIAGGNISTARIRFGNSDASFGLLLQGDDKGNFKYIPQKQSGLKIKGDIRSFCTIGKTLLVGKNNDSIQAYKWSNK